MSLLALPFASLSTNAFDIASGNSGRILKVLSRYVVFALSYGEEGVQPEGLLCHVYYPLDEHPFYHTVTQ